MPRVEHVAAAAMNLRRSMINPSLPITVMLMSRHKRRIIWRAITDVIAT
jgi:hypothetical protein